MKRKEITRLPATEFFGAVKQMMSEGYDVEFTVTGNSMWPILSHGRDSVIIGSCGENKVKVGDTVLYCPIPDKYILHRIISLKDGNFSASGDGNCFCDGTFSIDCIVGKVTAYIRKGKKYSADGFVMRVWSFCWRLLYPVRRLLLKLLRKLILLKRR